MRHLAYGRAMERLQHLPLQLGKTLTVEIIVLIELPNNFPNFIAKEDITKLPGKRLLDIEE